MAAASFSSSSRAFRARALIAFQPSMAFFSWNFGFGGVSCSGVWSSIDVVSVGVVSSFASVLDLASVGVVSVGESSFVFVLGSGFCCMVL